jgi:hypothetical protein
MIPAYPLIPCGNHAACGRIGRAVRLRCTCFSSAFPAALRLSEIAGQYDISSGAVGLDLAELSGWNDHAKARWWMLLW